MLVLSFSRRKGLSTAAIAAGVIVLLVIAGGASYFIGQGSAGTITKSFTQTTTTTVTKSGGSAQTLALFNAAAGSATSPFTVFTVAAGKDKGFYASNGLSPVWIGTPTLTSARYKNYIGNGTLIGLGVTGDILTAEAGGAPIKLVGAISGNAVQYIAVLASSSYKTFADLNGKRLGVDGTSASAPITATERFWLGVQNKTGVHLAYVYNGNANASLIAGQQLASLQGGTSDAIASVDPGIYSMVLAGQLRVVAFVKDFAIQPTAAQGIWATNSLIQSNPALVKAFVKSVLQTVSYLNQTQNQAYEGNLWSQAFGVSSAVGNAAAALTAPYWSPNGLGSGNSLLAAATNVWNDALASGTIPAGTKLDVASAINTSFLGG